MIEKVSPKLAEYIEKKIFPIYNTFDKGHDLNHITAVIDRALLLASDLPNVNIDIVYATAALHDIGIKVQRKNHAMYSGEFVANNKELRNFFTEEEIEIIKQGVEDHSTSKGIEPRNIYGKIVCDADKDSNIEVSLLRAYEFTKSYYPDYTEEECFKNVHEHLKFKFGENGKVKFWIKNKSQEAFLNKMKYLAYNEDEFNKALKAVLTAK